MKYYHGTTTKFDLKVGDMILPPNDTNNVQEIGRKKNLDKVFMTISPKSAKIYAGRAKNVFGGEGIVYEVEPVGEIETLNTKKGTEVYMSPKAKIIGIVTLKESRFDKLYEKYMLESKKIIAYHGTNKRFKEFDKDYTPQGVFWFSENKDKILGGTSGALSSKYMYTVELTVKKTAGWDEYDKYFLAELQQRGYDSINLDDDWVIFDPKNIEILKIEETDE